MKAFLVMTHKFLLLPQNLNLTENINCAHATEVSKHKIYTQNRYSLYWPN